MSKIDDQAELLWSDVVQSFLEDDDVEAIYKRLDLLRVELDDDPLTFGPKRLNHKTSACRKALGECERIFAAVSQKIARTKKELRAKSAALELSTKYLFANDPEVRSGRNVSDREAIAAVKLKDEWLQVKHLEQQVEDYGAVMIVVKAKRSDLKDIQGRLRDQLRLCQEELGLNAQWGSKPAPNSKGPDLTPGLAPELSELDELIARLGSEVHVGPASDTEVEGESSPVEVAEVADGDVVKITGEVPVVPVASPVFTNPSTETFTLPDAGLDALAEALCPPGTPVEVGAEEANTQIELTPQVDDQLGSPDPLEALPGDGSDQEIDSLLGGVDVAVKIVKPHEIDEQTLDDILEAFN